MKDRVWNRREVLRSGAQAAAATAVAGLTGHPAAGQFPPPQPLTDPRASFVVTTADSPWQTGTVYQASFRWDLLNLNIGPEQMSQARATPHGMEGFGACFNELGWTSLAKLSAQDRESVMQELFDPAAGARFSYCRMPIGANDFSTGPYSYDEVDGDFDLRHFSIEHDRATLIPFIHAAQRHRSDLRLWASPWTPPSWMKRNHFYAEAKAYPGMKDNGIRPDQIGHEGEDMFILKPRYLDAYAKYFARFIEAYRQEGIRVGMVMPQNEFNSAQNFPSCTWTPAGLAQLLARLGPRMHALGVEVFFGTLERGNPQLLNAVLAEPSAAPWVQGVGVQWAGKNALPAIHREHPALVLFQSEQECGDGSNSWTYTGYCWQLMKDYFRNGATGYMYWNISLLDTAESTWGWKQNSLVSVHAATGSYTYNHDYYLLKHLTHFVDIGAKFLPVTGTCDDALGFLNPDGAVVLLLRNELPVEQHVQIGVPGRDVQVVLAPDSIGTLRLEA